MEQHGVLLLEIPVERRNEAWKRTDNCGMDMGRSTLNFQLNQYLTIWQHWMTRSATALYLATSNIATYMTAQVGPPESRDCQQGKGVVYSCSILGCTRTDVTSTDYGIISTSSP
jgi:hypothetical protein